MSILSVFRKEFNKFNITVAQMLDSIYHMTFNLKNLIFGMKGHDFATFYMTL